MSEPLAILKTICIQGNTLTIECNETATKFFTVHYVGSRRKFVSKRTFSSYASARSHYAHLIDKVLSSYVK